MDTVTGTLGTAPLSRQDRCDDDCPAAAQARVVMPSGAELLFCEHHTRQHEEALRERGAQIFDEAGCSYS